MAFFHDKDLKHLLLDQNCCQVISQSKLRMRVISVHDYTKHPTEYCGEQNIPEESHILPYNCRSDVGHKKGFPNNILLYSLHFNKNICTCVSIFPTQIGLVTSIFIHLIIFILHHFMPPSKNHKTDFNPSLHIKHGRHSNTKRWKQMEKEARTGRKGTLVSRIRRDPAALCLDLF